MEKVLTQRCLEPGEERQALHLVQWKEARKREAQLEPVPPTDFHESIEITVLVRRMALLGIPVSISAIAAILALLIHNTGLWIIPVLAGIIGLVYLTRTILLAYFSRTTPGGSDPL